MSILLHSGMRLNLATGQVFLTQNTTQGSSSSSESNQNTKEEVGTTDGAEGETGTGDGTTDGTEGETGTGDGTTDGSEGETGTGDGTTVESDGEAESEGETTVGEGETGTETTEAEGETGLNGESVDEATDGTEGLSGTDTGMYGDGYTGMDIGMDIGMDTGAGTEVKDPLLSNWFFVGGISAATLVVSIVLGILLAKKRIKKGIHLYED